MRFSISVHVGRGVVTCEAEGDALDDVVAKLEASIREIPKLAAQITALDCGLLGKGQSSEVGSASKYVADHFDEIKDGSKTDQLIAILYSKFLENSTSSLSPVEMKRAFSDSGLLAPVNINDTVLKALRRGLITKSSERGEYRLTTPGQRHAESRLRSEA